MFEYANESVLFVLEANLRGTIFRDLAIKVRAYIIPALSRREDSWVDKKLNSFKNLEDL